MTTPTHQQAAEGALTNEQCNDLILGFKRDPTLEAARARLRTWLAALPTAQGQAAPVVPAGWKLVPAEATPEMMRRGMSELSFGAPIDSDMANAWYAMLAAVPAVPLPSEQSAQSQGACPAGTALSAPAATRRPLQSHGAKCWRCKGSGDMEVTAGQGPDTWTETTICSQCGGTGVEDD